LVRWLAPVLVAQLLACASAPPVRFTEPDREASRPLALLGDPQRTLWVERLIGREQNDESRAALDKDLAAQRPGLLVLLGDLTNAGGSQSEWERFDELFAPIRGAGIPMLALLGNHDYWGREEEALANAAARFPQLGQKRWYLRAFGRLALVLLDSNEPQLGESRWEEQSDWYRRTLAALDGDPAVSGVLVLAHHPPYTNSRTTGDEEHVQRAFLPAFFAARKTLAFVTGHAHAYERFEERGRTFIVSGGGGGPRVRLLAGAHARHRDLHSAGSPRPFHYLLVEQDASGARVTVRGLDKGETEARVIDRFELPFAAN
jgi:3',5'-cyclic AMP phosphodiesterase CpdA